jgi:hypothetical protein
MSTEEPIHIGGTSGTGKSTFALYLLHRLMDPELHKNHAFIYRHGEIYQGCFISFHGKVYTHKSVIDIFQDQVLLKLFTADSTRPIWTILDGGPAIPTGTPETNMIVLTSPGKESDALKHFLKSAITLVNPPWTLADIESVRSQVYVGLDAKAVEEQYLKWGGIPRILLDWGKEPQKLERLEASIFVRDSASLFRQAGLSEIDHTSVSGLHFHLVPGRKIPLTLSDSEIEETFSFRYPAYCWASTWIHDRFWEELKNAEGELSILNFLLDRNNQATARALAFEPHVFRTLENVGLYGRVKELTSNGPVNLKPVGLTKYIRRTFHDFESLPATRDPKEYAGIFYVPGQSNHMSFDFYVPDKGLLVQITIGQRHGVKREGLDKAARSKLFALWRIDNPGKRLRVLFLCDQFNYLGFTKQPYMNVSGTTLKDKRLLSNLERDYCQYAMELDVRSQQVRHLQEHPAPKNNPYPSRDEFELLSKFGTFGSGQSDVESKDGGDSDDSDDSDDDSYDSEHSYDSDDSSTSNNNREVQKRHDAPCTCNCNAGDRRSKERRGPRKRKMKRTGMPSKREQRKRKRRH